MQEEMEEMRSSKDVFDSYSLLNHTEMSVISNHLLISYGFVDHAEMYLV
jgi:hypothetical protein